MAITKYPVVSSAIKLVQRGTATITATNTSTTATITAVDVNKTFLNMTFYTDDGADTGSTRLVNSYLTNTTTITFTIFNAVSAGKTITINWEAIEYI